jgi:hypothetical protein
MPISPVGAIEVAQIHLRDRVNHKPRRVPRGQPTTDIRPQQERLITISGKEVLPQWS